MRKGELLDLSFGYTPCGYKIKIDGKFIQRTTFSFSTDSLLYTMDIAHNIIQLLPYTIPYEQRI